MIVRKGMGEVPPTFEQWLALNPGEPQFKTPENCAPIDQACVARNSATELQNVATHDKQQADFIAYMSTWGLTHSFSSYIPVAGGGGSSSGLSLTNEQVQQARLMGYSDPTHMSAGQLANVNAAVAAKGVTVPPLNPATGSSSTSGGPNPVQQGGGGSVTGPSPTQSQGTGTAPSPTPQDATGGFALPSFLTNSIAIGSLNIPVWLLIAAGVGIYFSMERR